MGIGVFVCGLTGCFTFYKIVCMRCSVSGFWQWGRSNFCYDLWRCFGRGVAVANYVSERNGMPKRQHEIRDPVHAFIHYDDDERRVIDSEPFQRLRYIHQLAMTYQVYPGATHRRFEHSLGCMELATRIFNTITAHNNLNGLHPEHREMLSELEDGGKLGYWRKVLRLAALCHDMGHLPFSHAAEDLLPEGVTHETITKRIIKSLGDLWSGMTPPVTPEHIIKVAVGPKEAGDLSPFTPWERILAEIVTGDVFGADRMDYLLRDSLHAGVTYGHFDHHRLIDTLRILPGVAQDDSQEYSDEPELGIEQGGLQVAESLLMARYLMFSQIYFHHVRRVYDLHLKQFLKATLDEGTYPSVLNEFLSITDNEILCRIRASAKDADNPGHIAAVCISQRQHFRKVYTCMAQDIAHDFNALDLVKQGLAAEVGAENILVDTVDKGMASSSVFPILADDARILSSFGESRLMTNLPAATTGYLFVHPAKRKKACDWVRNNVRRIFNH